MNHNKKSDWKNMNETVMFKEMYNNYKRNPSETQQYDNKPVVFYDEYDPMFDAYPCEDMEMVSVQSID